jgi:hypothetical protein
MTMQNLKLNDLGLDRIYSVYNNSGSLLIYTSCSRLSNFVAERASSASPGLRLRVGGDSIHNK